MNFKLLTLFPEMFPGPLNYSLAGKALDSGKWSFSTVNIRDYAEDKHGTVDDICYGGGTGMVMRPDILGNAIDKNIGKNSKLLYMSPRGKIFNQNKAYELVNSPEDIVIICGRYEGIDQRIIDKYEIEEVSMGDFVLSGGEIAALMLMDACIRLLPGVISKGEALNEESFGKNKEYAGLLEYPLYTRPSEWDGYKVPDVLLSGNHEKIAAWRLAQAQEITKKRRPDLWRLYNSFTNNNGDSAFKLKDDNEV